jgi:hypothetical protein
MNVRKSLVLLRGVVSLLLANDSNSAIDETMKQYPALKFML